VAIIPDGDPGLRIIVLHIEAAIGQGARVEAGRTVLGRVRALSVYFRSDIGTYYTGDEGNHAHLQVNLAE
jgi:hypothetical protein